LLVFLLKKPRETEEPPPSLAISSTQSVHSRAPVSLQGTSNK
jgi:hypothetical protein